VLKGQGIFIHKTAHLEKKPQRPAGIDARAGPPHANPFYELVLFGIKLDTTL